MTGTTAVETGNDDNGNDYGYGYDYDYDYDNQSNSILDETNNNNDNDKDDSEDDHQAPLPLPVPTESSTTINTNENDIDNDDYGGDDDASPDGGKLQQTQTQQQEQEQHRSSHQPQEEHPQESNDDDDDDDDQQQQQQQQQQQPPFKLYKSTRFKGYLTIALASVINQNAAALSRDPAYVNAVPASPSQQKYAQAVSIVSAIIAGTTVVLHLDRYSPLRHVWRDVVFSNKSKMELAIIGFLLVWWTVATIIQTGVRGVAGDGKEQYNLYCSTWLCCYTCYWTMERKLLEFGYPTLTNFVTSWPYRAPGWIAIFGSCFFTLFWYVDLFINTAKFPDRVAEPLEPFYSNIPKSQYQWLVLVAALTLLPSGVFIFAELLRKSSSNNNNNDNHNNNGTSNTASTDVIVVKKKGTLETILEGFCLFLLAASWIPSVIVATTPGGFASLIGNAYFFTWATTIFVVETFLWFIQDFRGNVHKALMEKEAEYKRHQQDVLQKSRQYYIYNGVGGVHHHHQHQQQHYHNNNRQDDDNNNNNNNNNKHEIRLAAGGWESSSSCRSFDADEGQIEFVRDNNKRSGVNTDDDGDPLKSIYYNPANNDNLGGGGGGGGGIVHSPARFQERPLIGNGDGDDDDDDNSAAREMRLKESNADGYYQTLGDILE